MFEEFFTSFETLHHSSGEYQFNKRGIGLGLAITKKFVEMHGGTVGFESTVGKGSVFRISFPKLSSRTLERSHGDGIETSITGR